MAVEQLSSRTVTAISAAAATDMLSQLREGAILEGRVLAINPDDTLKLATRLGQLDIAPSLVAASGGHAGRVRQTLSDDLIGTTVRFEVAAQPSNSGRLIVRLITGDETPQTAATGAQAPDTAEPALADISARIAAEVAQAAAQQDGLAPVFSTAAALQGLSDQLPDALVKALANLAGFAQNAEDFATPEAVRKAFLGSGLFLESKLALLAANGGTLDPSHPLSGQDLKAALLTLKPLLDAWVSTQQAAHNDVSAGRQTSSVPVGMASGPVPPAGAGAGEAAMAGSAGTPVDTEALFAVLRPPPVAVAQSAEAMKALAAVPLTAMPGGMPLSPFTDAGTMAQLGAMMAGTGLAVPASNRRGPYGGRPLATNYALRVTDETPVATGRPPPPRRGSLPLGQAAVATASDGPGPNRAADLAKALSAQVSNAVARISLGQYASLPESAAATHASGLSARDDTSSWLFEIPISVARSISIAQFEIDQVHERMAGAEAAGPAWRVQFSLDVNELGPVHARLVLGGQQIAVGLWAEAAPGIATVSTLLPLMRRRLEEAGLTVAEIHFAAGRPPSGPPARAGGFIDRNA